MSNGARHGLGVLAGVVLTATLAGLLIYGSYKLQHDYALRLRKQDKWIGAALLAGAAIAFALLASSRISPVGALIGGLVLTAAGLLYFASAKTTADWVNKVPFKGQRTTIMSLEGSGMVLFVGVGLLVAALFPSRWRPADSDGSASYEYGVPDSTPSYGARQPDQGYGAARPTAEDTRYDPYGTHQQTSYDTPLYEPPGQGYGRAPFSPSEEDPGSTREIRRPE